MTFITWACLRCVQELATISGPQNPTQRSCVLYSGELFGRVDLGAELSEDCAAGRLILSRCSSLLLRFELATSTESKKYKKGRKVKLNRKKIWECLIEDTLKSVVYIRLSSKMVEENKLTPDMKLKAEVQFKLSRMSMIGE